VCGLFAEDVVLSYPSSPNRGRAEFCDQIGRRFEDPGHAYTYAEPDIHEILVVGDLAIVKLFWTLTVTDASGEVAYLLPGLLALSRSAFAVLPARAIGSTGAVRILAAGGCHLGSHACQYIPP